MRPGDGTVPQDLSDSVAATILGSAWMTGRTDEISLTRVRVEDVYPGDVAQEWLARWRDNPKALEKELST